MKNAEQCCLSYNCHHRDNIHREALTHWGWVMHICISNLTIIGSDNGLAPGWHQAIIWTIAGKLLIGPLGKNFSEILIELIFFQENTLAAIFSRPQFVNFRNSNNIVFCWIWKSNYMMLGLTHWGRNKMAVIFRSHFKTHFHERTFMCFYLNYTSTYFEGPIYNKTSLVWVMARCQTCDNSVL